jgi:hypothetical protein
MLKFIGDNFRWIAGGFGRAVDGVNDIAQALRLAAFYKANWILSASLGP